jgi:hypothetical protein
MEGEGMKWLMKKLFGKETLLGQIMQAEQNMMEEWARNPRSFDPVERKWLDAERKWLDHENRIKALEGGK